MSLQNTATPIASTIHGINESSSTTMLNFRRDFGSSSNPAVIKMQVKATCLKEKNSLTHMHSKTSPFNPFFLFMMVGTCYY